MSAAATPHHCPRCGFTGEFSGAGPHECPGCNGELCCTAVAPSPPLQPAELLQRLDGWMSATGHGDDHPWRRSIAATLNVAQATKSNEAARLKTLVDEISVAADTLSHFAVHAANRSEHLEASYDFYAVSAMADRIGAIADLSGQDPKALVQRLIGTVPFPADEAAAEVQS